MLVPWDPILAHFLLSGGIALSESELLEKYQKSSLDLVIAQQKELFKKYPELASLYHDIELPVSQIICDMHTAGIYIDQARLKAVQETMQKKREDLSTKLSQQLGDVNLNSPKQLGDALETRETATEIVPDQRAHLVHHRGDGVLVYQNRHWRYENSTSVTSQATIGDGVGELPYTKLELSYDDSQIWNDVRITPTGGTVQTASDSTSQSTYAKRTLARTLIIGDASGVGGNTQAVEAKSAAQYLLANYKEPALRATSASVRPVSDATGALWTQILNRALSDRITTTKRPPGGGAAITGDYFIEAIEHRIGNVAEDWETTWQLSPANAQAFWIMQNATFGLLDSTTRLAY